MGRPPSDTPINTQQAPNLVNAFGSGGPDTIDNNASSSLFADPFTTDPFGASERSSDLFNSQFTSHSNNTHIDAVSKLETPFKSDPFAEDKSGSTSELFSDFNTSILSSGEAVAPSLLSSALSKLSKSESSSPKPSSTPVLGSASDNPFVTSNNGSFPDPTNTWFQSVENDVLTSPSSDPGLGSLSDFQASTSNIDTSIQTSTSIQHLEGMFESSTDSKKPQTPSLDFGSLSDFGSGLGLGSGQGLQPLNGQGTTNLGSLSSTEGGADQFGSLPGIPSALLGSGSRDSVAPDLSGVRACLFLLTPFFPFIPTLVTFRL